MYKTFKNPTTGRTKEVKVGYSWTVFFFGIIPMLFRKDWLSALVCFFIAYALNYILPTIIFISPSVIFYIIVAYYYNEYYEKQLIKKGYIQIA